MKRVVCGAVVLALVMGFGIAASSAEKEKKPNDQGNYDQGPQGRRFPD